MIVVMLAVALVILVASTARAADRPDGWSCEAVRTEVERLGVVRSVATALAYGLTRKEIKEIRRRCKV